MIRARVRGMVGIMKTKGLLIFAAYMLAVSGK